jgi:hypothetical protein
VHCGRARHGRGPRVRRCAMGAHRAPASVESSSRAATIAFQATGHCDLVGRTEWRAAGSACGCRANPPSREFVVDNSNDPRGDAGVRTEESQVATTPNGLARAVVGLFSNASGLPDSVPGSRRPPLRNENRRGYFQVATTNPGSRRSRGSAPERAAAMREEQRRGAHAGSPSSRGSREVAADVRRCTEADRWRRGTATQRLTRLSGERTIRPR